jgi:hypothetical protein
LGIAQRAPLYESAPPKYYSRTERVMSYVAEELLQKGQVVTLLASGDSNANRRLVATCRRSLRLDKRYHDQVARNQEVSEET